MYVSMVYTPEEAAAYLKVHVNTIYKLLRSGRLPAAKLGRDWRIPGGALDDYLYGRLRSQGGYGTGPEPEDAVWLDTDLSRLGETEPYDWGPQGPPQGKRISYIPGKGPVVEGGKRRG